MLKMLNLSCLNAKRQAGLKFKHENQCPHRRKVFGNINKNVQFGMVKDLQTLRTASQTLASTSRPQQQQPHLTTTFRSKNTNPFFLYNSRQSGKSGKSCKLVHFATKYTVLPGLPRERVG